MPKTALGANLDREDTIPHLHKAELGDTLNHFTWADDLVLISTAADTLTQMVAELIIVLQEAASRIKWGKARDMSLYRPAAITVAGHRLEAEDDLTFLG